MTRARELSKLGNTNIINVDSSYNVGIGSLTPDAKLDVIGIISATSFSGSGANLSGIAAGADLSAGSDTQRVLVTSKTSGAMDTAATDADLSWNSTTNTLSAPTLSGNITGTAATFSGDVSVGGVLTYEDVTNVDSVGVITARSGIKVGAGESISAVSGTLTYYGDGSNLDGVESGVVNFVASGSIANGATVILKDDGTVGIVTAQSPSNPNQVEFDSDKCYSTNTIYIGNGKVVIAYRDDGNSNYGTAIVGTVSGSSISFGSPVVFDSNRVDHMVSAYDSANGKFVISWARSSVIYDVVGSVSGTTPSFGSVQNRGSGSYPALTYTDSGAGKLILAYGSNVKVGTINNSNNTVTWGSDIATGASSVYSSTLAFDTTNDRLAVFYTQSSTTYKLKLRVGTLSGSNITFGSEIDINDNNCQQVKASITSASNSSPNIPVVSYYVHGVGTYITAVQLTLGGGNTISGSVATEAWRSSYTGNPAAPNLVTSDSSQELFTLTADTGKYNEAVVVATGGGSGTPSITTNNVVNLSYYSPSSNLNYWDRSTSVWVPTVDKTFYAFLDDSSVPASYATLVTPYSTTLTADNYIGIAGEAISNAATGKISVVGGTNTGQSGLTTAQTYYVQVDGTLATAADTPSVVAGTSISDTEILVWKS